jgi:FAD/FMN-containing dehydrogenase
VGYGGAAPRVRGSVVIDLGKRMSKILDINPDDYTCLVEPGVSFYALQQKGLLICGLTPLILEVVPLLETHWIVG